MDPWWGQVIFWTATIIAILMVLSAVWTYVFNIEQSYPVLPIVPLLLAAFIWLVGWACRYASRQT